MRSGARGSNCCAAVTVERVEGRRPSGGRAQALEGSYCIVGTNLAIRPVPWDDPNHWPTDNRGTDNG